LDSAGRHQRGHLSDWVRGDFGEGIIEVHPAVINAAAIVMLNEHGEFPLEECLAKVKEIDHERGSQIARRAGQAPTTENETV
jgi:hypothetical protein